MDVKAALLFQGSQGSILEEQHLLFKSFCYSPSDLCTARQFNNSFQNCRLRDAFRHASFVNEENYLGMILPIIYLVSSELNA